jgi:hypothetical protein
MPNYDAIIIGTAPKIRCDLPSPQSCQTSAVRFRVTINLPVQRTAAPSRMVMHQRVSCVPRCLLFI